MINNNIEKEHVLKAIEWINQNGIVGNRESRKYHLKYNSHFYPPKYVLSIANTFLNGKELSASEFSGGDETNSFLIKLGFEVVEGKNDVQLKSENKNKIRIATVLIQNHGKYDNDTRDIIIEKSIELCGRDTEIVLFPGGTYNYKKISENCIEEIESKVKNIIKKWNQEIIVCLGVDSDDLKDQIGISVSKNGIIAMGRKFHPAPGEENNIRMAKNEHEKELHFNRTFEFRGHKFFIAVCYDGFGIKHKN